MALMRTAERAGLILTVVLVSYTSVFGGSFRVGDRIRTVDESPVMIGTRTLATLPPGTRLVATEVQKEWVAVTVSSRGQNITGWIKQDHLTVDYGDLQAIFRDQDSLAHEQAAQYQLPVGKPVVVSVTSQRPVDVFVVSEEGLENFKWIAKNGRGQMQSYRRRLNIRSTQFEWTPPNGQKFRLLVDNTTFPDAGARPFGHTQITVRYFRPAMQLDDPAPGLGLVLGRVRLEYDGYKGRRGACSEPLTVQIAHKSADQDDDDAQVIEVPANDNGWFAVGNLIPDHYYWVKAVDGLTFTVEPSFRVSGPIQSDNADDEQSLVRDVGLFVFRVNADGRVSTTLTGPDLQIASRESEKGSSVNFGAAGPLSRHEWFENEHADSGWLAIVRADRLRLEEARRKKQSEEVPVPVVAPEPDAVPVTPSDDVAPAPAPPAESPRDERPVALR